MKEREEKLQEEIQEKCGKSQEKIFYISAVSCRIERESMKTDARMPWERKSFVCARTAASRSGRKKWRQERERGQMETAQMKNQITEGVIWKQLLMFFFPIMIGTFFQQLYNTIDTVVVGQFVGTKALASVGGSSSQMINLVVGFFTGLSSGASVIIAQY